METKGLGAIYYTDPEDGKRHLLDAVQTRNYTILKNQGLHPEDAATVAYLMESEEPGQLTIDWAEVFLTPILASKLIGVSRQHIGQLTKQSDHPEWRPVMEQTLGGRLIMRLFSRGRVNWINEGMPAA